MAKRNDIRRLAMQVLYQIDVTGVADPSVILGELDEHHDPLEVREAATSLAVEAWHRRQDADRLASEVAPDWPTHRQPRVDRAILRLAYHEMISGRVHLRIAINEAVELAKQYGGEGTPMFVNAVLDKIARTLPAPAEETGTSEDVPREVNPDAWLADATGDRPA